MIDLGKKPEAPCKVSESAKPCKEPKVYYPSLYINGTESLNLPDGEFTFTARGRKVSETERIDKVSDKEEYSCEIEVMGIDDIKAAKESDKKAPKEKGKKSSDEDLNAAFSEEAKKSMPDEAKYDDEEESDE